MRVVNIERAERRARNQVAHALSAQDNLSIRQIVDQCDPSVNARQASVILHDMVMRGHVLKSKQSGTFIFALTTHGKVALQQLTEARALLEKPSTDDASFSSTPVETVQFPRIYLRTLAIAVAMIPALTADQRTALAAAIKEAA
jgi:predicted transcriptional regulator